MPNLSVHIPKYAPQKESASGIVTVPPVERPLKSFSVSSLLSVLTEIEKLFPAVRFCPIDSSAPALEFFRQTAFSFSQSVFSFRTLSLIILEFPFYHHRQTILSSQRIQNYYASPLQKIRKCDAQNIRVQKRPIRYQTALCFPDTA